MTIQYVASRKTKPIYMTPIIPQGYRHIDGEWNNGFVIERVLDGSQFVWIPVGFLKSNGTHDGKNFNVKFGRRNFCHDDFSKKGFYEPMTEELKKQCQSVQEYGGFYLSRYYISPNEETGNPQSKKNAVPYYRITQYEAVQIANKMESDESAGVSSHLLYGSEYDSVLEWFIDSKARTLDEIAVCSENWGNYSSTVYCPGHSEEWCTNKIYDFAGNSYLWTQERAYNEFINDAVVLRGGRYYYGRPVAHRWNVAPTYKNLYVIRVALYIAPSQKSECIFE